MQSTTKKGTGGHRNGRRKPPPQPSNADRYLLGRAVVNGKLCVVVIERLMELPHARNLDRPRPERARDI